MGWKDELFEKIQQADRPVLLWSGGIDSTVLLAILRQQSKDFDIWQSRDLWTKEQREYSDSLIKKWKLRVFSFPAREVSFIGQGDDLTAVFDYGVPMLKDIVPGSGCIADLEAHRLSQSPFSWDLHIVGSRKEDAHWATGQIIPAKEWQSECKTFYAPLFDLTREEVWALAKEYEIEPPTEDTGDLRICSACLRSNETGTVFCPKEQIDIPVINWNPMENTRRFREYYGISR